MPAVEISSIEWHDVPVASLAITESGLYVALAVFDDDAGHFRSLELRVSRPARLSIDLQGDLGSRDLHDLEIHRFDLTWTQLGATGTLHLLPGSAGYWRISFADAQLSLNEMAP